MSFPSINNDSAEQVTRRYKGQFASLKFPRRVYKEYPKIIKDPSGKKIGRAINAMEEAEILANAGLAANAVDPVAAMAAELEEAKRKLAQYEGKDTAKNIAAKPTGAKTQSVEMLPEDKVEVAPDVPKQGPVAANPLLKGAPATPNVGKQ